MTASNYQSFPAVYILNLARSTDRWSELQPVLAAMGFSNTIRIEAVDGFALGPEEIQQMQDAGRLARDLSEFDPECTEGEIGCALSHAAAVRDIVERDWPSAIIFEDDIMLAGNPGSWQRRFQRAFADLPPDWELWFLYRCLDVLHRTKRTTRRTLIPWTPQGGAAYAVTRQGARKLLAALTPVSNAVDRIYSEMVRSRSIRAWAASPMLILPGDQPSIINRNTRTKDWVCEGVNRPPEYWPENYLQYVGEKAPLRLLGSVRRMVSRVVQTMGGRLAP